VSTLLGFPVIDCNLDIPIDIQLGNIASYILVEITCLDEQGEQKIIYTTLDKVMHDFSVQTNEETTI